MKENLENSLMTFNFDKTEIRTIDDNGKILFCGSDVARALGYKDTAKALTTHCKKDGWAFYPLIDDIGREQKTKFISEGNLYRLITHSRLSSAKKFEKWVFDEVLPSIRKHGAYIAPEKTKELEESPAKIKELCETIKTEYMKNKELEEKLAEKEEIIAKQEEEISDLTLAERYLNEEEMDIHLSTGASAYKFMNNEYLAEVVVTKLRKLMQDKKKLQEENEKLRESNKIDSAVTLTDNVIPVKEHIKIMRSLLQTIDRK